jgi:acyl CoA:acetate/3-ketoacid CoA transferase alpha subunit
MNRIEAIPESFTIRLTESGRRDLIMISETLGVSVEEALSRAVGTEAYTSRPKF